MNSILIEPRHLTWLDLPRNLFSLSISDRAGGLYCQLNRPSDALARAALWEAVTQYAERWNGDHSAPPLEIQAIPNRT